MAETEHFQDDSNVDDSKLKLPDVEFAKVEVKNAEEDEEVVIKTCVHVPLPLHPAIDC